MKFVCPKCKFPLLVSDIGCAVCGKGHTYDKSRYGYYNLLLSNKSGGHGDNKEMVEARRAFLDTDAYLPLAETLCDTVIEYSNHNTELLDIGLGEGYYTDKIEKKLREKYGKSCVVGFDISKDAVRYAKKKNKNISVAVASAYRMPIADGSFDISLNVFSPLAREETHRVLRKGGKFIMVIPNEKHLYSLKANVYDTPYKNTVADAALDGFKLLKTVNIEYSLTMKDAAQIRALFMMTPYAYRTPLAAREKVFAMKELTTEVQFIIFVYEKR